MKYCGQLEYAHSRPLRSRNKPHYRIAHWPIWVAVFFLAPGASTFALFDHGLHLWNGIWLFIVIGGTGVAGWHGRLPGTERQPYLLRFDEDRPNLIYRRVCYVFAWNAIISFAVLNLFGLVFADLTGHGCMELIYRFGYPPVCCSILIMGAAGVLPRCGARTKAEGLERRRFYGSVWTVTTAQVLLLAAWKMQWPPEIANPLKLLVFGTAIAVGGCVTSRGLLPRTRPIVSGEVVAAD